MSAVPVAPPPALSANDVGQTCLVTGGSGYLGRALVSRLLEAGCTVRSIDLSDVSPDPRADHRVADLRDYAAVHESAAGVDTVFHAAALISTVDEALAQPALKRLAYGVNVVGTNNVVRAALSSDASALVHVSSFNVVMDHPIDGGDESLPYATRSNDLYTLTKIAAERAALSVDSSGGLRTCAIRPGGIWGSGRGGMMIDAFVAELAKGAFKATIGDGHTTLDATHVDNVIDAALLAARALRRTPGTVGGKAYFVTDDERIDAMEWFRPIVEGLGHRFPAIRVPGTVMMRVASALEFAHRCGAPPPTITKRSIRNLTEGAHFSIEAAQRDLGYTPRYRREHLRLILPELRAYRDSLRAGTV